MPQPTPPIWGVLQVRKGQCGDRKKRVTQRDVMVGLHEQALLGSPGWVIWGHLGAQGLGVHWRRESALLLQHTHEHPLQVKAKVRDECKPVFWAQRRQGPLKESGVTLELGPFGQSALCCCSQFASRSPWQGGFHPTAQLDLFLIFILQDLF